MKLSERVASMKTKGRLRFSVCQGAGWVSGFDEQTLRTLAELYNQREAVSAALKARGL